MYANSLAAVFAQYPLGLVQECIDPRVGLARSREFPPTVAVLVEWLDKRLAHHQAMANWRPEALPPPRVEQEFSDDHRQEMLGRLSVLMHEIFDGKAERHRDYVRPVGRFERAGDDWNRQRRQQPWKDDHARRKGA